MIHEGSQIQKMPVHTQANTHKQMTRYMIFILELTLKKHRCRETQEQRCKEMWLGVVDVDDNQ